MSNIVGLNGGAIRPPGEANPEVIEIAEKLLDMANSGEIKSLFAFHIHSDDTVGSEQRGELSYRLIGVVTAELQSMCASLK